jgi:hypothetical protein
MAGRVVGPASSCSSSHHAGAPLAAAGIGVGIFASRTSSLWLPMPFALASLPTLRRLGEKQPGADGKAEESALEPALRRS